MKFKIGDKVEINWLALQRENHILYDLYMKESGSKLPICGHVINHITGSYYSVDVGFRNIGIWDMYLTFIEHIPKFKVGDKVKINWDRTGFIKYEGFRNYGNICEVGEKNRICVNNFSILNPSWRIDFCIDSADDVLTLANKSITGKSKSKFKKNEIVLAKHIDGKPYEFVIDSVEEQLLMENIYKCYIINDKNKLIYEFPESSLNSTGNSIVSKPKWSVGTYVEFLEDYTLSNKDVVRKGFYEIIIYSENLEFIELNLNGIMWKFFIKDFHFLDKIKWHENKPEKDNKKFFVEINSLPLSVPKIQVPPARICEDIGYYKVKETWNKTFKPGYKSEWRAVDENDEKYRAWFGKKNKDNKARGQWPDATNAVTEEQLQEDLECVCKELFGLRMEDQQNKLYERYGKSPLTGLSYRKQKVIDKKDKEYTIDDFVRIWRETGYIFFSDTKPTPVFNILKKPEIKISKQKKISININKPKIK